MRPPNRHNIYVVYNLQKGERKIPQSLSDAAYFSSRRNWTFFSVKIHANKLRMAQKSSAISANETLISNLESQLDRLVEQLKDLEECK